MPCSIHVSGTFRFCWKIVHEDHEDLHAVLHSGNFPADFAATFIALATAFPADSRVFPADSRDACMHAACARVPV